VLLRANGVRVVLIEREKFPREKVAAIAESDCWPILRRSISIKVSRLAAPASSIGWNLLIYVIVICASICRVGRMLRSQQTKRV